MLNRDRQVVNRMNGRSLVMPNRERVLTEQPRQGYALTLRARLRIMSSHYGMERMKDANQASHIANDVIQAA